MSNKYISDYEVKLRCFGHIIYGNIEYYLPNVHRRLAYSFRGEGQSPDDPNGNKRFMAKILDLCIEDMHSIDIKVYEDDSGAPKPVLDRTKVDGKTVKLEELLDDDLGSWTPEGKTPVEHIIDKELLYYYDFGQEVCMAYMLHMGKGFSPGKKYRANSSS